MRLFAVIAWLVASSQIAHAEDLPRTSKLSWTANDGSWTQAAILEFAAIGVLGAGREAGFPEVGRLRGGEPEALRLHVGALGLFDWVAYVVRVDLSEPLRIVADDVRNRPFAAGNRVLESAYVRLGGKRERVIIGRQPVGVSRFQQVALGLVATGAVPFTVDRLFPSRRWGVRAKSTRGRLDASLGVWLDGDSVEPRVVVDDASIGSDVAVTATGRVVVHGESQPHWLAPEAHASVFASAIARAGDEARGDFIVGAEAGQDRFAGVLELIGSSEGDVSAAAEASALLHPKSAVFVRGDYDGEREIVATGGGITYFATKDRRSRVEFYAWFRRDRDELSERSGAVILLQAEL